MAYKCRVRRKHAYFARPSARHFKFLYLSSNQQVRSFTLHLAWPYCIRRTFSSPCPGTLAVKWPSSLFLMSLWLPRPPPSSLLHASLRGPAPNKFILLHPRLITTLLHSSGATSISRSSLYNDSRTVAAIGSYSSSRFASTDTTKATSSSTPHTTTAVNDPNTSHTTPKASPPAPKEEPKEPLGTRVWKKVKHEAQHYWHGSKLLAKEVRISARLQWKILHGESLTRRERRQVSLRLC